MELFVHPINVKSNHYNSKSNLNPPLQSFGQIQAEGTIRITIHDAHKKLHNICLRQFPSLIPSERRRNRKIRTKRASKMLPA